MKTETDSSSIKRAFDIIELFLNSSAGFTTQEIQDATQISRSTLYNLLKSLKEIGYLQQNEARGRYYAGIRLSAWNAAESISFPALINAFQQEVNAHPCPETLALAVPSPQGLLLLDQIESAQLIRAVYTIGAALVPPSSAQQLFTKPAEFSIQENGYLLSEQAGSYELCVPICQDGIQPTAVILLNAPIFRWQAQDLINNWLPQLRAMAARISHRLGALFYSPYQSNVSTAIEPTTSMNPTEIQHFLQGPWAARLACIRPDGHPHVIPVWQEWDGTAFYIPAWKGSQWVEFINQNSLVSLTIDEPWAPLRRIVVRGTANLQDALSAEEKSNLLGRLATRYLGQNTPVGLQYQVETIYYVRPQSMRGWYGLPAATGKNHAN